MTTSRLDPTAAGAGFGDYLRDPAGFVARLAHAVTEIAAAWAPVGGPALAALVLGWFGGRRWWVRRRHDRLCVGARQIVVLPPPVVDPAGGEALWSNLVGLLRPGWRRTWAGQPHLGFEYLFDQAGAQIRIWVPGPVPPGLVEHAVQAAWPGAHTRTEPAQPPLPDPARPGAAGRRVVVGGRLRLARSEALPIRTRFDADPVRALFGAPVGLGPGEHACVQILARPVTGRRVVRARRAAHRHATTASRPAGRILDGLTALLRGLLSGLLDLLTGEAAARHSPRGASARDPQTALEDAAVNRAVVAKQRGSQYATTITYAVVHRAHDAPAHDTPLDTALDIGVDMGVVDTATGGAGANRDAAGSSGGADGPRHRLAIHDTAIQDAAVRDAAAPDIAVHDIAAQVPAGPNRAPDRAAVLAAVDVARGRAHALAAAFAAYTEHNRYRRERLRRPARALRERRLGRGDLLSVPELAALAHLPVDEHIPGLVRAGARALAPPPGIAVPGPGVKPLGVTDTGPARGVGLRVVDARHHLHVVGATGAGKSTLLAQLVLDDATAGRGVVLVDPKGDLVTDLLARLPASCADRVVLLDADSRARPPCLNPLDPGREPSQVTGARSPATHSDSEDKVRGDGAGDLAVDNLVSVFRRLYAAWWGPRTDDVMRAACLTLRAGPGIATLADLPTLLTDPAFRARATAPISDPVLRGFWAWYEALSDPARAQVIAPLLNKLRAFLLRPFARAALAGGPADLDLGEVLDHGGILLVRIPKGSLGDETCRLVGSLVVARVWQATTARAATPQHQRPDASLVIDECHNFLHLPYAIEDMLAEARGFRLAMTLAHQHLAQLPRELREGLSTNARSKIYFNASPEDARDLARHTQPRLTEHDLAHLDAFHAAARLVSYGAQAPAFTLHTRPLPPPVPGRARVLRTAVARRYDRPHPTAPPSPQPPDRSAAATTRSSAGPGARRGPESISPARGADPRRRA